MTREEFERAVFYAVREYFDNDYAYDSNPQLRINPSSLQVLLVNGSDLFAEIEDSDEAVENAAEAHGQANQEGTDYQVTQNPDFYPVKNYIIVNSQGQRHPDEKAIAALADKYF